MKKVLRGALLIIFCLAVLVTSLASCGGNTPAIADHVTDISQENGITSVLVAKNGQKLTISASLS